MNYSARMDGVAQNMNISMGSPSYGTRGLAIFLGENDRTVQAMEGRFAGGVFVQGTTGTTALIEAVEVDLEARVGITL
jgi:hypothetical protein